MRRNKGFTLIELLIVFIILLILFAIGLNSWFAYSYRMNQHREQAVEIITQQEELKQELEREIEELEKNADPHMKINPDEGDKNKL